MKFDYAVGNPPYQEENENSTRKSPVYNYFMDAAFAIADKSCLITPARFLFNVRKANKQWNRKMLEDEHFKVLEYEKNSSKVFANVDITGGVIISYYDNAKSFGCIGTFTVYNEINGVLAKVHRCTKNYMNEIVSSQGIYRLSDLFFSDYPEAKNRIGKGTGSKIVSNLFEKIPEAFIAGINDNDRFDDYYKMYGRFESKRTFRFIKKSYVLMNDYIDNYNVIVPEGNGSANIGGV